MRIEPQSPHIVGYALVAFGALAAIFFWFIMGNVPMSALGIGIAVVGSSLAITPLSPVPSATVRRMLEGSLQNTEAVLEELGVSEKGFYVPKADGSVQVYAPMGTGFAMPPPPDAPVEGLVTKINGRQVLVIFPPASSLMKNLDPTDARGVDLEGAISEALVEEAGLADSLKATESAGAVAIEISSPKSKAGAGRVSNVMGSLEAGIAAAIVARAKRRAVSVDSEENSQGGRKRKVALAIH